ncbi:CLUMA_CG015534, isoform A [Clunio marinus]|uniref:CLUMA_CG015534, isoform A n=1 Tax=Clunio marinus TaxID=568069 RepID=A0A1J1IR11_9DIPT|nr:CLUMA_CG015534, isoform A [Clunio marinus]
MSSRIVSSTKFKIVIHCSSVQIFQKLVLRNSLKADSTYYTTGCLLAAFTLFENAQAFHFVAIIRSNRHEKQLW